MDYTEKDLDIAEKALMQRGLKGLFKYSDNAHQVRYIMEHTGYTWAESEALLDHVRKGLSGRFTSKPVGGKFGIGDLFANLIGGLLLTGAGGLVVSLSFSSFDLVGLLVSVAVFAAGLFMLSVVWSSVWRFIRGRDLETGIRLRKASARNVQTEAPAADSSTAPTDGSTAQDIPWEPTKTELLIAQKAFTNYHEHDEQIAFIREHTGYDQVQAEMLLTQASELFERSVVQGQTWMLNFAKLVQYASAIPFLYGVIAFLIIPLLFMLLIAFSMLLVAVVAILFDHQVGLDLWINLGMAVVLSGVGIWIGIWIIRRMILFLRRRVARLQVRDFHGIRGSDAQAHYSHSRRKGGYESGGDGDSSGDSGG